MNPKNYLIKYFKFRLLLLPVFFILINLFWTQIFHILVNYRKGIITLSRLRRYTFFNTGFENLFFVFNAKFNLLINNLILSATSLAVITITYIILLKFKKGKLIVRYTLYYLAFLTMYLLIQKLWPIQNIMFFVFMILLVYIMDILLFYKKCVFDNSCMRGIINVVFFVFYGFSEILFAPLYIKYLDYISNKKINNYRFNQTHFIFIIIISMFLLSPAKFNNRVVSIKKGTNGYGGLVISDMTSKLFFTNVMKSSIEERDLSIQNATFKTIYKNKNNIRPKRISGWLAYNKYANDLYIIDRAIPALITLDLNNHKIKNQIIDPMFDAGGCRFVLRKNNLYVIDEDNLNICKIDLLNFVITLRKNISNIGESAGITYNKGNDMLYVTNWLDNKEYQNYFIWEINPENLEIVRTVRVPSPVGNILFENNKNRAYINILAKKGSILYSYIFIYDTKTLKVIDNIKVPFGLRDIAFDEERGLLFAGNALVNIVEIIDLKTKKVVDVFKCGDYLLTHIALDTKRRYCYVTTQHFGIYRFNY